MGDVGKSAILLSLVFVGCSSDEPCVGDLCADFENERSYPGPCSSRHTGYRAEATGGCTFEYDAAGRVTLASCAQDPSPISDPINPHVSWTWTGDTLTGIREMVTGFYRYTTDWTFRSDAIEVASDSEFLCTSVTYDPSVFRLLPRVGRGWAFPSAIGIVADHCGGSTIDLTWMREGNHLVQTYNGDVVTEADLDEQERIVRLRDRAKTSTYTFEGDLLVEEVHEAIDSSWTNTIVHVYDRGKNIAASTYTDNADTAREDVYDYNCWSR